MNTDCSPIWHAVVRYEYHRSKYFDSPFYWWRESRCFDTMAQARDWADAEHPELPGFKVMAVYMEAVPTLKHTGVGPAESRLGRSTDDDILRRRY